MLRSRGVARWVCRPLSSMSPRDALQLVDAVSMVPTRTFQPGGGELSFTDARSLGETFILSRDIFTALLHADGWDGWDFYMGSDV